MVDDFDGDSELSFRSGPVASRPLVKHAWTTNDKVRCYARPNHPCMSHHS